MEGEYEGLQVQEDMSFQQRNWRVERMGWVIMALIALASILGLIGSGFISTTRKGAPATLQIEFERFPHLQTSTQIQVKAPANGPISLQLPHRYLSRVEVSNVMPEPDSVRSQDGIVTYTFSGAQGTAEIAWDMKPRKPGTLKGFVQRGTHRIEFTQFVYP